MSSTWNDGWESRTEEASRAENNLLRTAEEGRLHCKAATRLPLKQMVRERHFRCFQNLVLHLAAFLVSTFPSAFSELMEEETAPVVVGFVNLVKKLDFYHLFLESVCEPMIALPYIATLNVF